MILRAIRQDRDDDRWLRDDAIADILAARARKGPVVEISARMAREIARRLTERRAA